MAMIYDITNDTAANEGDMAIIQPYNAAGASKTELRLCLTVISWKYGGGSTLS